MRTLQIQMRSSWDAKNPSGETFVLYNVTATNHPLYGSTVLEKTLRLQHLQVPPTPNMPEHSKRSDFEKQ
jgi:hypothetical protein